MVLAAWYYAVGADELTLLNTTSFQHSLPHNQPMLAVVRTAAANIFIPLTLGSGIRNTTVDLDGMPRPTLKVEGMYFHAIGDVSGASHKNHRNDPVQKMESLIQSIVFLSRILYTVWA